MCVYCFGRTGRILTKSTMEAMRFEAEEFAKLPLQTWQKRIIEPKKKPVTIEDLEREFDRLHGYRNRAIIEDDSIEIPEEYMKILREDLNKVFFISTPKIPTGTFSSIYEVPIFISKSRSVVIK